MLTTLLNDQHCPKCNASINAATSDKSHVPKPGDISICWTCGAFLIFDDNMNQIEMPQELYDSLDADLQLQLTALRIESEVFKELGY